MKKSPYRANCSIPGAILLDAGYTITLSLLVEGVPPSRTATAGLLYSARRRFPPEPHIQPKVSLHLLGSPLGEGFPPSRTTTEGLPSLARLSPLGEGFQPSRTATAGLLYSARRRCPTEPHNRPKVSLHLLGSSLSSDVLPHIDQVGVRDAVVQLQVAPTHAVVRRDAAERVAWAGHIVITISIIQGTAEPARALMSTVIPAGHVQDLSRIEIMGIERPRIRRLQVSQCDAAVACDLCQPVASLHGIRTAARRPGMCAIGGCKACQHQN